MGKLNSKVPPIACVCGALAAVQGQVVEAGHFLLLAFRRVWEYEALAALLFG